MKRKRTKKICKPPDQFYYDRYMVLLAKRAKQVINMIGRKMFMEVG